MGWYYINTIVCILLLDILCIIFQLRIYVEQYDIRPSIDDTYQAEAANGGALIDLLKDKTNQVTNTVICTQTLGILMILATIIVIATCARVKSKKSQNFCEGNMINLKEYTLHKQAVIISISINGMLFLLYAIALDGAAIHYRNNSLLHDLKIIHHKDSRGQPFDVLFNLPVVVLVFDILAGLFCIIWFLIVSICFCYKEKSTKGYSLFTVAPSLLGPIFGIINHSPFIAIAYINDAYYAGSIFVYYTVMFFVCFAAVHLTTSACLWSLLDNNNTQSWIHQIICNPNANGCERRICYVIWFMCVSVLMLVLISSVVATVICYFVIIPLNGSVSNAPNRLIGFYQTIIILLGIFITYKTVIHKKRSGLKRALKNRTEPLLHGKTKSDTENSRGKEGQKGSQQEMELQGHAEASGRDEGKNPLITKTTDHESDTESGQDLTTQQKKDKSHTKSGDNVIMEQKTEPETKSGGNEQKIESDTESWEDLSDQQKATEFYSMVIEVLKEYYDRSRIQKDSCEEAKSTEETKV